MVEKREEYQLRAFYIAREINLLKTAEKLDKNLISRRREFLTYLLGPQEFLFVFSFGAVVFANITTDTQNAIRRSLGRFLIKPVKKNYEESYVIKENNEKLEVTAGGAEIPSVGIEEIEITARVLAQSVGLDHIEDLTEEILGNIAAMNARLEKSGKFLRGTKPILKLSAQNSNIIQFVISKLSLLDKPDILWEKERLETFFSQLADLFELRSRFRNIEYKIGFARDNSEFALSVLASERGNFLELVIVILIVIEISFYFFGK
ncbi:MAG: RMD1 family protein [bacterium]|nr:RMD1 family protein [bacterium]